MHELAAAAEAGLERAALSYLVADCQPGLNRLKAIVYLVLPVVYRFNGFVLRVELEEILLEIVV
jgi:hypothetical protein